MDISLWNEVLLVLYGIIYGAIIGLLFDAFRVSRLVFKLNAVAVFIEDIFFCIITAVSFFAFCFIFNDGQIRLFTIIAAILGWVIYYFALGRFIFRIVQKILNWIKDLITKHQHKKHLKNEEN